MLQGYFATLVDPELDVPDRSLERTPCKPSLVRCRRVPRNLYSRVLAFLDQEIKSFYDALI